MAAGRFGRECSTSSVTSSAIATLLLADDGRISKQAEEEGVLTVSAFLWLTAVGVGVTAGAVIAWLLG